MIVSEMIKAVRSQCLEQDFDPITDESIVQRLNFSYSFCYNHFCKSNDAMFAKWTYFDVIYGVARYEIPKHLWGKRIESLEFPTPPQQGYQPFNYIQVEKVDPKHFHKFEAPRARTPLPLAWAQVRNEIMIAPPPLMQTKARILATPALVPLAQVEGCIMDFSGNTLTLDRAPTATLSNYLSAQGMNFLSICDGQTGEVKACYTYEAINGVQITLGSASNRTVVKGQEVRKCYSHSGNKLTYDPLLKTITSTFQTAVQGVNLGDFVEITDVAEAGVGYNIEDVLEDDLDFYKPAEYVVTANQFTRGGEVVGLGTSYITWKDPLATPPFTNGYPTEATVFTGNCDGTLTQTTYDSNTVYNLTMTVPHGLTIGKVYKVSLANTGIAALNGDQKVIVNTALSFTILKPSLAEVDFNPLTATWTLYKYSALDVETGWPALKDISPSTPPVATIDVTINSPYVYTLKDVRRDSSPETYDHTNDVCMDDVVCWGYATGVPIIPEAYHELLVQYAVLTLKSSMNESDTEVAALLKELFTSIKGDTAGRTLGSKIQRDFGSRSNYLTQSRRLGRR